MVYNAIAWNILQGKVRRTGSSDDVTKVPNFAVAERMVGCGLSRLYGNNDW